MIESLSDLKKLLQLCRKQGVTEIELGTVRIKLGDLPIEPGEAKEVVEEDSFHGMTEEEIDVLTGLPKMAFYSAPQGTEQ